MTKFISLMILCLTMTACSGDGLNKQTGGSILGGIGGAIVGSQFGSGTGRLVTTTIGALFGSYLGSEAGKSMDKADRDAADQAATLAQTGPLGESVAWNNPESGHFGTITPTRDGHDEAGNFCREFQTSAMIEGQSENGTGIACRQPDGSWKVMK